MKVAMTTFQCKIKRERQGKRSIIRKCILGVSRYKMSLLIWPVVLCPVLQDFSKGSSLLGIKWLLVGDFFCNSYTISEWFLACDTRISFLGICANGDSE